MPRYSCRVCGHSIIVKPRNDYPGKLYTCSDCMKDPPVELRCKGATHRGERCKLIQLPHSDFCKYHKD